MNTKLVLSTIDQLLKEVNKAKSISDKKKEKIIKSLKDVHIKYEDLEVPEELKQQYNQLNSKGIELVKELRNSKIDNKNEIENNIETYIRYLKASVFDFEGRNNYLRKYITSFLFSSILFLALSPQFYGFILPVLFFLPIYLGLKGVKQRSMTGFYMTMSVVPVAFMTAATWIRYGISASKDYTRAVASIVESGVSQNLAQNLVWIGPLFGVLLLLFSIIQLYRGFKSKDLFI
ncbi:hypothetical protein EAI30_11695 [Romboutsia ilealis]|uniref:Alpha-glucosidase n=1 Tax=Romboutsia faecis TaxID=2764597 RepID=A0ABR7JPY8_9FIRM|nr:hypothetical protein [Romboutsia faecis]MBC5996979.1 hypothetical protein [Romboutsia faecis]MRN25281.1 hypothetical protein [Romboutsia ilealis]